MRLHSSFDNSRIPIPHKHPAVRGTGRVTADSPQFIFCRYLIVAHGTLGFEKVSGFWFGLPCVAETVNSAHRQRLILMLLDHSIGAHNARNTIFTPPAIAKMSQQHDAHGTTVHASYDNSRKRSCA